MPAKPKRRAPKRRKAAPKRRRPRWVLRIILMGGVLFAVFCATALATLWVSETMRRSPLPRATDSADIAEQFTEDERKALEDALKDREPAPNR